MGLGVYIKERRTIEPVYRLKDADVVGALVRVVSNRGAPNTRFYANEFELAGCAHLSATVDGLDPCVDGPLTVRQIEAQPASSPPVNV